jgi:sirohydrochlorin ferrochelatase
MARRPALVPVAHGSRDPRSAAVIAELVAEVTRRRPDLDVRPAFLGLTAPALPGVLDAVAADGHRDVVVAPLLLGEAYHARVDVPAAAAEVTRRHPRLRVAVADVLGADPRLVDLALRRLGKAAAPLDDPGLGVVWAAIGSSRPSANAAVRRLAAGLGAVAGFATAAPGIAESIESARAGGAVRVAVASWFLAPGLLPARVAAAAGPGVPVAEPLGADPVVAEVVLDRYQAAVERGAERLAG